MKMLVLIDPGHGGSDPGACHVESHHNLNISQYLARSLLNRGILPVMTRYVDSTISLEGRVQLSNWVVKPDCFLSIHCNSALNENAKGFEIYTTPGVTEADALATSIFDSMKRDLLSMTNRADMSDKDPDKEAGFFVLKGTIAPAVLVECGFLSNSFDKSQLDQPTFRMQAAEAIAKGVQNWGRAKRLCE